MSKPQKKTEKRIDNGIRLTLTDVCENALEDVPGFRWVTHQADYSNFPASLLITCVFDTEDDVVNAANAGQTSALQKQIHSKLLKTGIVLKKFEQQIIFDSEEACTREHDEDWSQRLSARAGRAVPKNRPH